MIRTTLIIIASLTLGALAAYPWGIVNTMGHEITCSLGTSFKPLEVLE